VQLFLFVEVVCALDVWAVALVRTFQAAGRAQLQPLKLCRSCSWVPIKHCGSLQLKPLCEWSWTPRLVPAEAGVRAPTNARVTSGTASSASTLLVTSNYCMRQSCRCYECCASCSELPSFEVCQQQQCHLHSSREHKLQWLCCEVVWQKTRRPYLLPAQVILLMGSFEILVAGQKREAPVPC
jgi:hypothetical protein